MSFGIELFSSSGEKIFDSRFLDGMMVVHDHGTIEITSLALDGSQQTHYQTIRPTTKTPQLFVPNLLYRLRGHLSTSPPGDRYIEWWVGPFDRNAQGEYYRFSIITRQAFIGGFRNESPLPWQIPWVVFVPV